MRRAGADERAVKLRQSSIPTFEITPEFGNFVALGAARATDGTLVSDELAETLTLGRDDTLALLDGVVDVGATFTYPDDGRRSGLGYAILFPTSDGRPSDECWIDVWPESAEVNSALRTVLLPTLVDADLATPQMLQLNSTHGITFDGGARFDQRFSRFAPVTVLGISVLVGLVAVRLRRLELASARHAGVRIGSQTLQMVLEAAVWASFAALASYAIVAFQLRFSPSASSEEVLALAAQAVWVSPPAVLVGTVLGVSVTRERHLFRYFQDR